MATKKKKVEDIDVQVTEVEAPKVIEPKVTKPKFKTEKYELLEDVQIGDKLIKKGTMYPLTVKGAKYFKSKFYIK